VKGLSGIFLIVALVLVSGLIAYVGDIVGRRMGRKRLSLFGMRPRHTAIAISVLAGMLITILTLGVAMSLSSDVKDGFLRVSQMRSQRASLSRRLAALNHELEQREEAFRRAREAAERDLQQAEAALGATTKQLEDTEAALEEQQEKLARASAEVKKREQVVTRQGLVVASLGKEQARLQQDIDNLRSWKAWATRDIAIQRGSPILFGAGQPLAAELLEGGRPAPAIREQMDQFIARLNTLVQTAGAQPPAEGKTAVVIGKPVADPDSDSLTWATSDQVLEAVVERIGETTGSVIVRAFSVVNTHVGEPVPIDFELFHNHLVFRQGETLAETILDGRLSQPALMAALVSLLRDEVGAKARAENVMPRATVGEPALFASPRAAVGEMSYEELFAAIERIREIGAPARVVAMASRDTWTIGPLEVDLLVSRVEGSSS
jgi:uncharacterized protein (DUF3084 family)